MTTSITATVKGQLEQELLELSAAADKAREEFESVESKAGRIKAAIAALDGVALPGKPEGKRKAMNPTASKSLVLDLIEKELSKRNIIGLVELKQHIERLLADTGHSRIGFSRRFEDACRSDRFVQSDGALRLAGSKATEATGVPRARHSAFAQAANGTTIGETNGTSFSDSSSHVK